MPGESIFTRLERRLGRGGFIALFAGTSLVLLVSFFVYDRMHLRRYVRLLHSVALGESVSQVEARLGERLKPSRPAGSDRGMYDEVETIGSPAGATSWYAWGVLKRQLRFGFDVHGRLVYAGLLGT